MTDEIEELRKQVNALKLQLNEARQSSTGNYYASDSALQNWTKITHLPDHGLPAQTVETIIHNNHQLDFNYLLNTSSYVNVSFEEAEQKVAMMGLKVNLADQTVYPQSFQMHDTAVNMIASLWHCPEQEDFEEYKVFPGAGTVGSTEACLLAGLALKFRWRKWYAKRHSMTAEEVIGVRPNLVISSCYQAAWEKLFKYMDIEPRLIKPSVDRFTLDPEKIAEAADDRTIGVVCIMGNHYGGQYDPVHEVNEVVQEINTQNEFQIGIHVDAASGGFIAPFQGDLPAWDFRLSNVMSISASGHKYGESCCGTGWVVWRRRRDLSEHVAISVTYLGGKADSFTLNFSRPASGVYVQFYKFLRYGNEGYRQSTKNMLDNTAYIRAALRNLEYQGKPRFIFLDSGDQPGLPVVTARLNPACEFTYDDVDLQHVLAQHHWYVSGYRMGFNHPISENYEALFRDEDADASMFRIVTKSNLTRSMADKLIASFHEAFAFLDAVDFSGAHGFNLQALRHKDQRRPSSHC